MPAGVPLKRPAGGAPCPAPSVDAEEHHTHANVDAAGPGAA